MITLCWHQLQVFRINVSGCWFQELRPDFSGQESDLLRVIKKSWFKCGLGCKGQYYLVIQVLILNQTGDVTSDSTRADMYLKMSRFYLSALSSPRQKLNSKLCLLLSLSLFFTYSIYSKNFVWKIPTSYWQRIRKTCLDFSKCILPLLSEPSLKALTKPNIFWGLKVSGSLFFLLLFFLWAHLCISRYIIINIIISRPNTGKKSW